MTPSHIDTPYENLLGKILEEGSQKDDRTGTGTISLFSQTLRYDLSDSFPLITTKRVFTRGIIEELLWFIAGDTNNTTLEDKNVNIWKQWAQEDGSLGPIYGKQLRNLESVEQVNPVTQKNYKLYDSDQKLSLGDIVVEGNAVHEHLFEVWSDITRNSELNTIDPAWREFSSFAQSAQKLPGWFNAQQQPDIYVLSNKVKTLTDIWSPDTTAWVHYEAHVVNVDGLSSAGTHFIYRKSDQLQEVINSIISSPDSRRHVVSLWNGADIPAMELPPCHGTVIQFYVYDGKLSCHMHQRSADMFLGVPFNIASYSLLTHMVAQQTGYDVGEFIWSGGDCHIYSNHIDQVKEQISRHPFPYPKLSLKKADSIDDYTVDHVDIIDYQHHPTITGEVSV